MSKSRALVAFVLAATAAPAFAQAVSGGQTPQPGGSMGTSSSYNNSNITSQYVEQQQLGNLPADQKAAVGTRTRSRPATKEELTPGAVVKDKSGVAIAKIDSVAADGVVVAVGASKIKVPVEAFGHNKAGLLFDMTKAQFEQVVAQAK